MEVLLMTPGVLCNFIYFLMADSINEILGAPRAGSESLTLRAVLFHMLLQSAFAMADKL